MAIDQNTKQYKEINGKVIGVKLEIVPVLNQQYRVETLTLIDENTARGKTVATFFVEGQKHKCMLGYPFAKDGNFQNKLAVGGSNNEHIITNGFNPNNSIGPLSIFVADERGNCISEIVTGLGLPNNHHVSFVVGFKKEVEVGIPDTDTPIETGDLQGRILRLENKFRILEKCFQDMIGEI